MITLVFSIILLFTFFEKKSIENFVKTCLTLKPDDKLWESEKYIKYNNCYAYAFTDIDPNRKDKPEPGYKHNLPPLEKKDYNCKTFIERILLDNPNTFYLGNNKNISSIDCGCNNHMVFLAIDQNKYDFHFYRKNSNNYWTHKPGSLEVLHKDSNNKLIVNPMDASRKYEIYNYETPCGFFCTDTNYIKN